ncbi:MAG: ADP-ribosylglycohydrolase family protein [Pirellulaceae bacterium]
MPSGNRQVLDRLCAQNKIHLVRSDVLDREPEPTSTVHWDKVEGMLLGLAIGDALGITTEGMLPAERRAQHGEVRNYLPNRHNQQRLGYPSDDTQVAFWTLEQLLADDGLIPENLANRLTQGHIFGIGSTVKEFLRKHADGLPWYECGPKSAGNGALMRIAPILIPHLRRPSSELWVDTVLAAMLTHNDAGSTATCVAFVNMLWQLLHMREAPAPEWWLQTYLDVAGPLEGARHYRPRNPDAPEFEGSLHQFVDANVSAAYRDGLSTLEASEGWYSGAYLLETFPSVLYILMRHGHDPEEAIVRAVNDTKDNDTIAAVVGAAVGALHGRSRLPERWITDLSGRTTDADDGKVFDLIAQAKTRWGS